MLRLLTQNDLMYEWRDFLPGSFLLLHSTTRRVSLIPPITSTWKPAIRKAGPPSTSVRPRPCLNRIRISSSNCSQEGLRFTTRTRSWLFRGPTVKPDFLYLEASASGIKYFHCLLGFGSFSRIGIDASQLSLERRFEYVLSRFLSDH